jgi:hypothetical protein
MKTLPLLLVALIVACGGSPGGSGGSGGSGGTGGSGGSAGAGGTTGTGATAGTGGMAGDGGSGGEAGRTGGMAGDGGSGGAAGGGEATGTLDPSFDGDGIVVHDNAAGGSGSDLGSALTIDAAGKIVVAGVSENARNNDMVIWRYK